jgi:hypothetical protein
MLAMNGQQGCYGRGGKDIGFSARRRRNEILKFAAGNLRLERCPIMFQPQSGTISTQHHTVIA